MTGPAVRRLHAGLGLAGPALRAAAVRLWRQDAGLTRRYGAYVHVMHQVVRASVPLMERAADRCDRLAPADPVASPLGRYLRHHITRELGHDDWLLADAAAAGLDPAAVAALAPPPAVARLVGAQYYWVEHHHPVVLLGYIAALEGHAPPPGLAERLADATGLPPEAFHTLRRHADLDGEHRAGLDRLLDRLPLDERLRAAVAVSALHTVAGVTELFDRIAAAPAAPASTLQEALRHA